MACWTRIAVSGRTRGSLFTTRDTVLKLTCALAATSRRVGRPARASVRPFPVAGWPPDLSPSPPITVVGWLGTLLRPPPHLVGLATVAALDNGVTSDAVGGSATCRASPGGAGCGARAHRFRRATLAARRPHGDARRAVRQVAAAPGAAQAVPGPLAAVSRSPTPISPRASRTFREHRRRVASRTSTGTSPRPGADTGPATPGAERPRP